MHPVPVVEGCPFPAEPAVSAHVFKILGLCLSRLLPCLSIVYVIFTFCQQRFIVFTSLAKFSPIAFVIPCSAHIQGEEDYTRAGIPGVGVHRGIALEAACHSDLNTEFQERTVIGPVSFIQ